MGRSSHRPRSGTPGGAQGLTLSPPFARAPEIPAVTGRWSVSGFVGLPGSFLRRRSKSRSTKKLPVPPPGPCQARGAPGGWPPLSVHLPAPVGGSASPPGTWSARGCDLAPAPAPALVDLWTGCPPRVPARHLPLPAPAARPPAAAHPRGLPLRPLLQTVPSAVPAARPSRPPHQARCGPSPVAHGPRPPLPTGERRRRLWGGPGALPGLSIPVTSTPKISRRFPALAG